MCELCIANNMTQTTGSKPFPVPCEGRNCFTDIVLRLHQDCGNYVEDLKIDYTLNPISYGLITQMVYVHGNCKRLPAADER